MIFVTNSVRSGEALLWCPVWINHTIFGEKREVIIAVITRNIYLNLTQSVNGLFVRTIYILKYTYQSIDKKYLPSICFFNLKPWRMEV